MGTSPIPAGPSSRSKAWAVTPAEAVYIGDSPFDIRSREGGRCLRGRGRMGRHPPGRRSARRRARRLRALAGGAPPLSSRAGLRPTAQPSCARLIEHHDYRYHVLDAPEIADRPTTRSSSSCARSRRSIPSSSRPIRRRSAWARRRRQGFPNIVHLSPMVSLEKVTTREALRVGGRRAQAARHRRAGRVVVEPKLDGSALSLVYEDGVLVRGATRGDGERGEEITAEPPDDRGHPAAHARRGAAARALEVRGEIFFRLDEFASFNEAQLRRTRPAPNTRNAAAGSLRQLDPAMTAERPLSTLSTASVWSTAPSSRRSGSASVAAGTRLPDEPGRGARRVDRRGRRRVRRLGDAARGARLRDRRDRDQGRLVRPAAAARLAPRAAALGACVQVGADARSTRLARSTPGRADGRPESASPSSSRSRSAA